jgi:hypothetical protein
MTILATLGGNWLFQNPNGVSSAYRSLHIDTSEWKRGRRRARVRLRRSSVASG